MTINECSGTMGKSKQVDIFAPSCSAVQLGRKDKPWTGVAGAFVEHQHLFFFESKMKRSSYSSNSFSYCHDYEVSFPFKCLRKFEMEI
jgi:hypothetical protein